MSVNKLTGFIIIIIIIIGGSGSRSGSGSGSGSDSGSGSGSGSGSSGSSSSSSNIFSIIIVMDKIITLLVAAHLTCWTLNQFVQALFVVTY